MKKKKKKKKKKTVWDSSNTCRAPVRDRQSRATVWGWDGEWPHKHTAAAAQRAKEGGYNHSTAPPFGGGFFFFFFSTLLSTSNSTPLRMSSFFLYQQQQSSIVCQLVFIYFSGPTRGKQTCPYTSFKRRNQEDEEGTQFIVNSSMDEEDARRFWRDVDDLERVQRQELTIDWRTLSIGSCLTIFLRSSNLFKLMMILSHSTVLWVSKKQHFECMARRKISIWNGWAG